MTLSKDDVLEIRKIIEEMTDRLCERIDSISRNLSEKKNTSMLEALPMTENQRTNPLLRPEPIYLVIPYNRPRTFVSAKQYGSVLGSKRVYQGHAG